MSLTPPPKVGTLQTALHTKAKSLARLPILRIVRQDLPPRCPGNCLRGAAVPTAAHPGVDGQGFADVEACGADGWLDDLAEELKNETYQPLPVRRVYIPKSDGKSRPLGILCIKDRVAQMAAVLVFGADLRGRPGARTTRLPPGSRHLDAVRQVERLIRAGHTEVVDAGLCGLFRRDPHAELLRSESRRISDGRVLRLLKMWLETPVEETDAKGHRRRTNQNKDLAMGTPQEKRFSPLLSNIYMRRFVKGWKAGGHSDVSVARIVNYADDFVICCRGTAESAMVVMRGMMSRLKLTVNGIEDRDSVACRRSHSTFLGYTLGRNYDRRTGTPYVGPRPSRGRRWTGSVARSVN